VPEAVLIPLVLTAATVGAGIYENAASNRQLAAGQAQQQVALQAQERASRAAEEDAQLQATGQSMSQQIARASGLRVLQFGGASQSGAGGLQSTLGDSSKGSATTLGG
jgi:hypothetical protein